MYCTSNENKNISKKINRVNVNVQNHANTHDLLIQTRWERKETWKIQVAAVINTILLSNIPKKIRNNNPI